MKTIMIAGLIVSASVFLCLIGYAGIAPRTFAENPALVHIFRVSGAGVVLGGGYFILKLFSDAIRSGTNRLIR